MTSVPLVSASALRSALKGQYHAALEMLRGETVEQFPDAVWIGAEHRNALW